MKKKLQTIIASALVVVVAAVPVFAEVTGVMTSTTVTMTTEPVVDPEPGQQKLPDYFIDLKDGLKAGQDYKGISVNIDMPVQTDKNPVEFTLDGESYTSLYTVQANGQAKANPNKGAVPKTGDFVKIVPEKDGIFTVVTNYIGTVAGKEKTLHFVGEKTADQPYVTKIDAADVHSYEVKKGETYYFYADASNAMISGIGIKYKDVQNIPDYFMDLKDGLKAGTYENGITVSEAMPINVANYFGEAIDFQLDGESYTAIGVVQGNNNVSGAPGDKDAAKAAAQIGTTGGVPTSGAYIKIAAKSDGVFTIVIKQNGAKAMYFAEETTAGTIKITDGFPTVKDEVIVKSYNVKAGKTYYFYGISTKPMISGMGIKYAEENQPEPDKTVAVTDITGVATKMTAGETITLAGTVAPANATNKTITWSIKNAGTTGATLSGDKLTAKEAGTVVVTATIAKGVSADKAFTKDFTITVEKKAETDTTVAVTDITGVAVEMTAGETITLAGTVAPETATNKTIVWSVKDAGTTGATVDGDKLTATAAGTVVVTATISKGVNATTDYTKDFTITVKEEEKPSVTVKLGDVNGDKKIDSADALMVLRYEVNVISDINKKAADVDKNGKVDSADALMILRHEVNVLTIQ